MEKYDFLESILKETAPTPPMFLTGSSFLSMWKMVKNCLQEKPEYAMP